MADKEEKIVSQEETGETALIDQIEGRVEAEMKHIEGRAKVRVAQGMQNEELEREGREMKDEAKKELEEKR